MPPRAKSAALPFLPLPPKMTTRPGNKDKHPGYIVRPKPRRTSEEVMHMKEAAAVKQTTDLEDRIKHLQTLAQLEDELYREDAEREIPTIPPRMLKAHRKAASGKENRDLNAPMPNGTDRNATAKDLTNHASAAPERQNLTDAAATAKPGSKRAYDEIQDDSDESTDQDDVPRASHSKKTKSMYRIDSESESADHENKSASGTTAKKQKPQRNDIYKMRETMPTSGTIVFPSESGQKRKTTELNKNAQMGKKGNGKKKARIDDTGLVDGWKKNALPSATSSAIAAANDDDSLVKYGGLVPDNETNEVEEAAAQQVKSKEAAIAPMVEIKPNPAVLNQHRSTLKAARNGDKKWKLCHLPGGTAVQLKFTNEVAPQVRKKAGTLPPWENPSVQDIQVIVGAVFGKGTYTVTEDNVWYGLSISRLNTWRNLISVTAMEVVTSHVEQHRAKFRTKEQVALLIKYYLQKVELPPAGSGAYTYNYQWRLWKDDGKKKRGLLQTPLILCTLGRAFLAKLNGFMDFGDEKPIGALILAMQAVGHALEHWVTGEKAEINKPFSYENYGDQNVLTQVTTGATGRTKAQQCTIRRATLLLSSINKFNESQWDDILQTATTYIPPTVSKKRAQSTPAPSSDAPEDVTPAEIILISDDDCSEPSNDGSDVESEGWDAVKELGGCTDYDSLVDFDLDEE